MGPRGNIPRESKKTFIKKVDDIEIAKEKKVERPKKEKPITAEQTTLDKYMDIEH